MPSVSATVTAFVNVNVVPMDTERVLVNQTVLVDGGRITALGPVNTVKMPAGAMQIDGQGQYLMPGLADMHAHLLMTGSESMVVPRLSSYLANGVTTIREIDAVWPYKEHVFKRLMAADVPSPRIYSAPFLRGSTPRRPDMAGIAEFLDPKVGLDSVVARVIAAKAAGYQFISVEGFMEAAAPEQRAVADSLLATARRLGLPLAWHGHGAPFEQVLAFGAYGGSVDHLYAFVDLLQRADADVSVSEIQARAAAVQRAGTWIAVTLDCTEQRQRPTGNIKVARRIVKALQEAGVGLLLGADADNAHGLSGSVVHEELQELVRAGLTPYQALRTGTRNVAQYMGLLGEQGTVTVGKYADLVLLHGNPLADLRYAREPVGVMLAGRWLDRAALDRRLLTSPRSWFEVEVLGGIMPQVTREQHTILPHFKKFEILADSLQIVRSKPAEYERLIRLSTDELGAIRAILTPAQRVAFDPVARTWMREHARQGYRVTISGVASVP